MATDRTPDRTANHTTDRQRERERLVDISCQILIETEKAYQIDAGEKEPVWLPKSQVEWDEHDGTMAMPMWLAKDKGLI